MKILKVIIFADNASAYNRMNNLCHLPEAVSNDFKIIFNWFITNKLSLNKSKRKLILFTKSNDPPDIELPVSIDFQVIQQTKSTKFLGVIVDKDVSWKDHIKACKAKLVCLLYAINAPKYQLDRKKYSYVVLYTVISAPDL